MTYQEAIDFLFTATPVFQQVGGSAYKPGLDRMLALDEYYKHPHKKYHTIHVEEQMGKEVHLIRLQPYFNLLATE